MSQILGGQSSVLAPPGERGLSSPSRPLRPTSMECNRSCIQPSSNSIPGHFKGNSPAEAGQMDWGRGGKGTEKQRGAPQDALCLTQSPAGGVELQPPKSRATPTGPRQPAGHSSCPKRTGWKGKGDTHTPLHVLLHQQFSEGASRDPSKP